MTSEPIHSARLASDAAAAPSALAPRPSPLAPLHASAALARRELVRFLRQRSRVVGALATPLVFWVLIGGGMGHSFVGPDGKSGYLGYFFPGTVLMIVLFTAIFSTISIIEDRREGFLQGVLVAPVPRWAVVLGKVLGAAALATLQAALFLLLAPLAGVPITIGGAAASLGLIVLIGLMLGAVGLTLAWPLSSTQGFHVLMNLLLMPMWMLSGALFPLRDDAHVAMKSIMLINPLTYALAALRGAMGGANPAVLCNQALNVGVTAGFTVIAFALASAVASRPARADLD